MSAVPRPQMLPLRTSPENGSTVQYSRVTGTTSMWLSSTNPGSGFATVAFSRATMFPRPGADSAVSKEIPSALKMPASHCAARASLPGGLDVSTRMYSESLAMASASTFCQSISGSAGAARLSPGATARKHIRKKDRNKRMASPQKNWARAGGPVRWWELYTGRRRQPQNCALRRYADRVAPRLPRQTFDHGAENYQAVGRAECRLGSALRVRHQAQDVALAVRDAGDVVERAVGISRKRRHRAGPAGLRGRVAENDLVIALQLLKRGRIAKIVPLGMRDGDFQDLSRPRGGGERRRRGLYPNVHVPADEAQAGIPQHGSGQQARFQQDLKSIADAQYQPAPPREFFNRSHQRRKPRDGAGAQVVAVSEPARQHDGVIASQVVGLVPDEINRLGKDGADGVVGVVVAIRARKDPHSEFHFACAPQKHILTHRDRSTVAATPFSGAVIPSEARDLSERFLGRGAAP